MTDTQKTRCRKIAEHYGESAQLSILQEECAELIQAVSKIRRCVPNAYDNYIDEIADVSIMIEQMISFMDNEDKNALYQKINEKLERQLDRIAKGE